jgi:hypothetical protein
MNHAHAVKTIGEELEKRLMAAGIHVNADASFSGCIYTMAELFIYLWEAMTKAVADGKKNHPMDRDFMQLAAREVGARLPDQWAFILFCFEPVENGRVMYAANTERAQAIAALKTWLLKVSPEEWLKHVE